MTPLESGTLSNVSVRSFQAVFDQDAFRNLYRHIHRHRLPPPSAPTMDFDRFVVVAAFMGRRPSLGYRIRFGDVAAIRNGRASVWVVESEPLPGTAQGQMITTPYALAALARTGCDAIDFVDAEGGVVKQVVVPKPERPSSSVMSR